jgi:tetrahydromethanopterin S-methyltransferase subunit A
MGCKPCLPVPAYNAFSEKMDTLDSIGRSELKPVRISTFLPSDFEHQHWPIQPGDYKVFDPKASVSVALLGSPQDFEFDSFSSLPGIAIVGSLTTENLGIEHVLKNVIANPFIRHLVLFGHDIQGHLPGDALIKLKNNGIGGDQRIQEAAGARPILKNVLGSEVEHFRKQVTLHNLIGQKDFASLSEELLLNAAISIPFKAGLFVELVEVTEARASKRLQLDPEGYFVVMAMRGKKNPIYVEHYKNNGCLMHIVEGKDAATVCSTLLQMNLVSQMDHASYLGRELAKAELSLKTGEQYVQDRAQGDLMCE